MFLQASRIDGLVTSDCEEGRLRRLEERGVGLGFGGRGGRMCYGEMKAEEYDKGVGGLVSCIIGVSSKSVSFHTYPALSSELVVSMTEASAGLLIRNSDADASTPKG